MALDFTVFLLDDDAAVLKAVGRLLQAAGYTTKTYCSRRSIPKRTRCLDTGLPCA